MSPEIEYANSINLLEYVNLSVHEASRIVGRATATPQFRIECTVYEVSTDEELDSMSVSPYACAEKDDQDQLRQITTLMSQGGDDIESVTFIREFRP